MENSEISKLEFFKLRFEYCKDIFLREIERREKLDNKARILLSFCFLFIGALVLNIDNLEKMFSYIETSEVLSTKKYLKLMYAGVALGLLLSLICIFMSLKIRVYKEIYPENFLVNFLSPTSTFFIDDNQNPINIKVNKSVESFYFTMTQYSIQVIEENSKLNKLKSRWLDTAWLFILFSIFVIVLGVIIVLLI